MERTANGALIEEFAGATPLGDFGKEKIHHVGDSFGAGQFEQLRGGGEFDGEGFFGKDGNAALKGKGNDVVLMAGNDGNGDCGGAALIEHGAPVAEEGDASLLTVIEDAFAALAKDADDFAAGDLEESRQVAI
jgi:hypothetical protein